MGKATKEVVKVQPAGTTALATPPRTAGAIVEGRDAAASISRLALFQGTAEEQEMYGDGFRRGEFIDTLERRSLGNSIKIIPIAGWVNWAKFVKGSKAPEYSTKIKAEVPPEDLVANWPTPPAATECINLIVVVDGEQFPMLFVFKRTGIKAYKTIESMEQRWGHSLYELGSVDDKNPEGKPFKRLTAKVVSKTPEAAVPIIAAIKAQLHAVMAKAEAEAAAGSDIPV